MESPMRSRLRGARQLEELPKLARKVQKKPTELQPAKHAKAEEPPAKSPSRRSVRLTAAESSRRSTQILQAVPGNVALKKPATEKKAPRASPSPARVSLRTRRSATATKADKERPLKRLKSATKSTTVASTKQKRDHSAPSSLKPSLKKKKKVRPTDIETKIAEEWSFPCRTKEFTTIQQFIEKSIETSTGGCMLIEGVPGTGKTATVLQVMKYLRWREEKDGLPPFQYCEINGIKLTDPAISYVRLAKVISDDAKSIGVKRALQFLDTRFRNPPKDHKTTVVLLDEMDKLSTSNKQKVIYNLFDWPQLPHSKLIVVAISNTMDLPEKMLMARIDSRISFHRLSFEAYTRQHLPDIIRYHIKGATLHEDAMALVCMRVAGKSGDARGALNIARRAYDLAVQREGKKKVGKDVVILVTDVSAACDELNSSPKILFMQNASKLEKVFLEGMILNNEEGAELDTLIGRIRAIYLDEGCQPPTVSAVMECASRLCALRLVKLTSASALFHTRFDLECSAVDVQFALQV